MIVKPGKSDLQKVVKPDASSLLDEWQALISTKFSLNDGKTGGI